MTGGAIPTTGRRSIHSAWEFISLRTQPAPLRCALALFAGPMGWPTSHLHCNELLARTFPRWPIDGRSMADPIGLEHGLERGVIAE
jgi:hypothetical protein